MNPLSVIWRPFRDWKFQRELRQELRRALKDKKNEPKDQNEKKISKAPNILTDKEWSILGKLNEASDEFFELDILYAVEQIEFLSVINHARAIVMSRAVKRSGRKKTGGDIDN